MTNKIGWIVAAAMACVLLLAGGVTALVVASSGDPTTVEDVADAAVDAAEDLDIDAGVDLMCESPSADDREDLADLIDEAKEDAGTDDPEVDYEISNVEGDAEGSFEVTITSTEDGLEDEEFHFRVLVEQRGERSCITGAEEAD